jgi:integrase
VERTRYPGIYRRGRRYVVVVSYTDGAGRRRQQWLSAATVAEAKDRRQDFLSGLGRGIVPQGAMPVRELLEDHWLPEMKTTRSPNTVASYEGIVRQYLVPGIGGVRLRDLGREHLRRLYRPLPPLTAYRAHRTLSAALGWAVRELGVLAANPCATMRPPHPGRREAPHLDPAEARRMLRVAQGHPLEGAIILGLVGGLRRAEVLGLRWSDIDLETGGVVVRRTVWGKTKSGRVRGLTLPRPQVAALRAYRRRQAEELLAVGVRQTEEQPVVADPLGRPLSLTGLYERWPLFRIEYGFQIPFHALRHTAAILMLVSGVDVKTAASRLGHTSPGLLLNVYAHYIDSADQAAAERLEKVLAEF